MNELDELPYQEKYGAVSAERLNEILTLQRQKGHKGYITSSELTKEIEKW